MSVLKISRSSLHKNEGKPIHSLDDSDHWTRPIDWLSVSVPSASEQKFVGLVAVFNNTSNYISFSFTVSSGLYTVDWGDGTTEDVSSGTAAQRNYVWSNVSSTTLTSRGYRQAIVTVTPKTVGASFTAVNLSRVHTSLSTAATATNYTNPWLEVYSATSSATSLILGGFTTANVRLVNNAMLEYANIIAHNTSTYAYLFGGAQSLQAVSMVHPNTVTNTSGMFSSCRSLKYAPFFNTESVTAFSQMFLDCNLLQKIPQYSTASATSFNQTFANCYSLEEVPPINFSLVTTTSLMFSNCYSLKSYGDVISNVNTNSATMFQNCSSIEYIGSVSTSATTSANGLFSGCSSLKEIGSINVGSSNNVAGMFSGCRSLRKFPSITWSSAPVTITQTFATCTLAVDFPSITASAVSAVGNNVLALGDATITNACGNASKISIIGNRWTLTLQNCKLPASELDSFYTNCMTLNPSLTSASGSGTTVTYTVGTANIGPFVAGRTVTITGVSPVAYNLTNAIIATVNTATGTFTVTNAATGAYVSGGVATIQDNKTITVTGNPGTTGDDPTIATNKGWTVTG